MIDGKTLRAIQILAIKAIEDNNFDFFYRRVCRWFSGKFHTPLKEVETYDTEYVFKTYFEDTLYDLQSDDEDKTKTDAYENYKEKVLQTEAEAKKAKISNKPIKDLEKDLDDAWEAQLLKDIENQKKASEFPKLEPIADLPDSYNLNGEGYDDIPQD